MQLPDTEVNDMDSQQEVEDYEENSYEYSDNADNVTEDNSSPTDQSMKEMIYYNVL